MRGRTTSVVAHRLTTVQAADRILVLEREDRGERHHDELLAAGGRYARKHGSAAPEPSTEDVELTG